MANATRTAKGRIGVCSWSLRPSTPEELRADLHALGLRRCQLALVPLIEEPGTWGAAPSVLREAGLAVPSGMLATIGEDYSTIESIRRTGGVVPDETWEGNLERATAAAEVAREAEIRLVSFHAGFMPEDPGSDDGRTLLERLDALGDLFGARGINLALETGQESAETLLRYLEALGRANVGVNFDPANMILYGSGDPTTALRRLRSHVMQVHVKDALPAETPGEWGREVPAGEGAVDWQPFFEIALEIDPPVDFVIEREAGSERMNDVASAAEFVARAIRDREERS